MNEESRRIIVHGLMSGLPLCGFTRELPVDWPSGHEWVDHQHVDYITCPKCRADTESILLNPTLAVPLKQSA